MSGHNHLKELADSPLDTPDPGDGGEILTTNKGRSTVAMACGTSAEARDLPAPTRAGIEIALTLSVRGAGGSVVVATEEALDGNGNNRLTFDTEGDYARLESINLVGKIVWRVLGGDGVVPSTV